MPSFVMVRIISKNGTLSGGPFVIPLALALVQHKVLTKAIRIEFELDNNDDGICPSSSVHGRDVQ